ncbi:MAG: NADH:ubiquinone reductase (Na(+)-transporting) subunit F [Planctomycetes bacterium]|nr:NADH:ubiquinone reductase (Na(+)-transporting) subunit F [Planctomycetota bacterium]
MAAFILSIVVFTTIILLLTAGVVYAGMKLTKQGEVKITINDDPDKALDTSPSGTLLSSLSEKSIFIPSACGGGGTCAMCKVTVSDGGGEVNPVEEGHLSRAEKKSGVRLSCQVKVRDDMKIEVPDELFNIKSYDVTVVSNENVATFIKEVVFQLDEGDSMDFKAGGYIQIEVPSGVYRFKNFDVEEQYRGDWDHFKLWDLETKVDEPIIRAYSMACHPAEKNLIKLNIRIATPPPRTTGIQPGLCSSYIFNLKAGDRAKISGPYGEFFINETEREMVYIGGGAGMAPMRSHIFHLFHTLKTKRKVSFWYGARSKREMFYVDDYDDIAANNDNFSWNCALSDPQPEDKWEGSTGFIHQVLLDEYLSKHEDPTEIEYYLCGPPMMIDAVVATLDSLGVEPEMIRYDSF